MSATYGGVRENRMFSGLCVLVMVAMGDVCTAKGCYGRSVYCYRLLWALCVLLRIAMGVVCTVNGCYGRCV